MLALSSTGCGTLGYIVDTYDSRSVKGDFEYQDATYRIFDRKDLSKVMVTPSIGSSMGNGFVRGSTLGAVNLHDDITRFTSVASAYLAKDRANQLCKVIDGKMLISPQWEFIYLCADKPKV